MTETNQATDKPTFLGPLQKIDELALKRIRLLTPKGEGLNALRHFSSLGEHGAVWFATTGAGYLLAKDQQSKRPWSDAAVNMVATYAVGVATKQVVKRPRPQLEGLPQLTKTPTQLSFPSSHATSSFAAVQALQGLIPTSITVPLATSLAASRLALGVHYPSDIVAGVALGTIVGRLNRNVLGRFGRGCKAA